MRTGDLVMVAIGSARRDPNMFEKPHDFVPDREPNGHISFAAVRTPAKSGPPTRATPPPFAPSTGSTNEWR
jgi:cytochrome P450